MKTHQSIYFFWLCLIACLSSACAEGEVQQVSQCEQVMECALERCITSAATSVTPECAQQCYCDQVCDASSTSCNQACLSAGATEFTPVSDFLKLSECMAQQSCADRSCAEASCGFAFQTCRFSDGDANPLSHNQTPATDTNSSQPPVGDSSSSQLDNDTSSTQNTHNTDAGSVVKTDTNTTTTPATSFVGSSCDSDAACGVTGAICLDLPGGYCTLGDCAGTSGVCPEGSKCYSFQDDTSYCLDSCADASECRVAEGYTCDEYNTCWPKSSSGGNSPVGGPCATDSDCADAGAQCYPEFSQGSPTGFINGYCLIPDCSTGTCPAGAVCEAIFQGGGTACLAACAATGECRNTEGYSCLSGDNGGMCFRGCGGESTCPTGYACDATAQYCVPACTDDFCGPDLVCADNGLCEEPPCTPGSCIEGLICSDSGKCVPDISGGPGAGPGPTCDNLPSPTCVDSGSEKCSDVIAFEPNEGPGYHDYNLNGEGYGAGTNNLGEYRSFARRDLVMLIKWATAYVDCKSTGWTGGNGYPLGLGDMSESLGEIPGTAINQPGHPPGTHVNGQDIDIAYYQNALTGYPNNYLRPICDHTVNGIEQYHCVSEPYMLDVWRSALFIGALFSSPRTRVIGVDGQAGDLISQALQVLCSDGWVPAAGCVPANQSLACEVEEYTPGSLCWKENGAAWFHHHHHHLHLSTYATASSFVESNLCLTPDCSPLDYSMDHLRDQQLLGHVRSEEFMPMSFQPFTPPF